MKAPTPTLKTKQIRASLCASVSGIVTKWSTASAANCASLTRRFAACSGVISSKRSPGLMACPYPTVRTPAAQ
jgi:hypothetical protein